MFVHNSSIVLHYIEDANVCGSVGCQSADAIITKPCTLLYYCILYRIWCTVHDGEGKL